LLRLLRDTDMVLCEDTRVTRKLLDRYDIDSSDGNGGSRLQSVHQHTDVGKIDGVVKKIAGGASALMVTDAGTPCISDPGWQLVHAALEAGVSVEAIPGPSAVTAALSIAGINCATFAFLGFPPVKKGRMTFFDALVSEERVVVLYESPHRIRKTLEAIGERMPERGVILGRELTKMYEETLRGTASELLETLSEKSKGEFVVILEAV